MPGAINESQVTQDEANLDRGQPESEEVLMYRRPASDCRQIRNFSGVTLAALSGVATLALMLFPATPGAAGTIATSDPSGAEASSGRRVVWIGVDGDNMPEADKPANIECREGVDSAIATVAADSVAAIVSGPVPAFCVLVVGAGCRMPNPKVRWRAPGLALRETARPTPAPPAVAVPIVVRGIAL